MNCRSPKYVWPALALTAEDMALLHSLRESWEPRVPISVFEFL